MISYEELCAALERYVARTGGVAAAAPGAAPLAPDPPTKETVMPPVAEFDDNTQVGLTVQPVYEDRSNELDIGDVMDDEQTKH